MAPQDKKPEQARGADQPSPTLELTAIGEQYVIPGCERRPTATKTQMELFR